MRLTTSRSRSRPVRALTKILLRGTFAKIGVKNLRWANYASVTGKTPEQRAGMLNRTELSFVAL
jgi:NAD(P)H dehydrogenase (quinone)